MKASSTLSLPNLHGSGVIGLSLKDRLKEAKVYLSDISSSALEVAKINREKLGLDVELLLGNSLEPLIEKGIRVDYLVANPPYVNHDDEVGVSVRQYEPHLALFSDDKAVYQAIFSQVRAIMRTDTIVMMLEINEKDGDLMLALVSKTLVGQIDAKIMRDIHGEDRFILIRTEYENTIDYNTTISQGRRCTRKGEVIAFPPKLSLDLELFWWKKSLSKAGRSQKKATNTTLYADVGRIEILKTMPIWWEDQKDCYYLYAWSTASLFVLRMMSLHLWLWGQGLLVFGSVNRRWCSV